MLFPVKNLRMPHVPLTLLFVTYLLTRNEMIQSYIAASFIFSHVGTQRSYSALIIRRSDGTEANEPVLRPECPFSREFEPTVEILA
ncbi:hypothetical protein PoB_001483000 [Plakobranchus ocellatus]|uniref:Secreted protein n=1 Tax=Plakobranchus ocellatus TaxID=259542 RepID=A0AAV3YYQ1_9GAST|nr:hypothetical protein PoB_001483000 [Plakobranchus ocellatus]